MLDDSCNGVRFFMVIVCLLITALMGRVPLDKGNNCVPLDDGRYGISFDGSGHSDI